jgi:LacI family kdg operon repressor
MNKKVTINDIAVKAGVSRTTISYYLNDRPHSMSDETRERIRKTIEELGYRPSRQARALRMQSSLTIGVIVADLSHSYTSLLLKGVLNGLNATRYNTLIMDSGDSREFEQKNIQKMLDEQVDGLVFEPMGHVTDDYGALKEGGVPLVQIDRYTEPLAWDAVVSDNFEKSRELTTLILQAGYRRIAVVSAPIFDITVRTARYEGLKDVAKGTDVEIEEFIVSEKHVWERLAAYIEQGDRQGVKTAIYAFNGDRIFEVMEFLRERHIEVPAQVGMAGYGDSPWIRLLVPGVTAVVQDPVAIGEKAAGRLIDLIRLKDDDSGRQAELVPEVFTVESKLDERKSL